jgi:hypothetical protein
MYDQRMARGGNPNSLLNIEPEVEAALVETAPSQEQIEARRAEAAAAATARREQAEAVFKQRIREQIEHEIEAKGIDPSLIDLSDEAMNARMAGLRKLLGEGYKVGEIHREVMMSGKSKLFLGETDEDGNVTEVKLLGFEQPNGDFRPVADMTSSLIG